VKKLAHEMAHLKFLIKNFAPGAKELSEARFEAQHDQIMAKIQFVEPITAKPHFWSQAVAKLRMKAQEDKVLHG
jgi:hypothetical protein